MIHIFDYYTPFYIYRYHFLKNLPSFLYKYVLKYKYYVQMKQKLDLSSPKRLSEKIQRLKLYGNNSKKTYLADKLRAKDYIKSVVPNLKYAKLYQVCDSFEELDFELLPEKFILKTNHAWQTNIVIENKNFIDEADLRKISEFYNKVLKINYAYWSYYEMQYRNIKPQIFAEELLDDNCDNYEVWCFNGSPRFITYRISKIHPKGYKYSEQYCFDTSWNHLDFNIRYKNTEKTAIELCSNKDKIIEYAQKLSQNIDFVRVDFMEINSEIYFCEFTFTPHSGFIPFFPKKYDLFYGNLLKI